MGQPVLTAAPTLSIAVVLTTAMAIATLPAEMPRRAAKLALVGAVIAVAAVALQGTHLRVNFTGSMPIGIYLLSRLPHDDVKRGMLVAACAPSRAAEIGDQRGYLAVGPCADRTELLLKFVVAIAGDG